MVKRKEMEIDIKFKGIRKKSRYKFVVDLFRFDKKYYFWRTSRECLTRDYFDRIGIGDEIRKYGGTIKWTGI